MRVKLLFPLFLLLPLVLVGASGGNAPKSEPTLQKFVDELPIPIHYQIGGGRWYPPVTLDMHLGQFEEKIHRDLPSVAQWGYNGHSPGPWIDVEKGQRLIVHWKNELPATHLYPIPKGADIISPDVRAVTHLHGAKVSEPKPLDRHHNNDGWPDAWTVSGEEQIAHYGDDQSARLLWYHDHAMGETGRNVAAGLLGLFSIRDGYERSLNLPSGRFEIPLMLQSRQVNPDNSLSYTDDIANEFYGNCTAVNGTIWPYINVEPRKYRFRIINVSNARSYGIKLIDQADQSAGPAFYQIGSDSGFLAETAVLNDPTNSTSPRLLLAPAERADVIIDFSKYAGHTFLLQNNSRDIGDNELLIPEVMLFKVGTTLSEPDRSSLPLTMKPIPRLDVNSVATTRRIVFNQVNMPDGTQMLQLNGKSWMDPIEEKPQVGTTEVWELLDTLTDVHPFHIHLVQFQIIDRTLFDVAKYLSTGEISFLAPPVPPAPNEMGWKDTVRVLPQMMTRIIMRFDSFAGYYVYHCHILEHEDMDMMRPFQIVDPAHYTP